MANDRVGIATRLESRLKWETLRMRERIGDARLKIHTAWERPKGAVGKDFKAHPYEAVPYAGLEKIQDRVRLGPDDVVVDLGCGKGRAVCWFARLPIKRSVGVEFDAELTSVARRNAIIMRGRRAPIEILTQDARKQSYASATVIFLFNPFGPSIMKPVVDRIDRDRAGQPLRIIYVNPVAAAVLDEAYGCVGPMNSQYHMIWSKHVLCCG